MVCIKVTKLLVYFGPINIYVKLSIKIICPKSKMKLGDGGGRSFERENVRSKRITAMQSSVILGISKTYY